MHNMHTTITILWNNQHNAIFYEGRFIMQIPVYDAHNNIVSVEEFTPNLDLYGTPSYKNEGCSMGLTRVTSGKYKGVLAILYNNEITPSGNYGVLISDHEAWELCQNRGKVHLIEELQIEWNRGII